MAGAAPDYSTAAMFPTMNLGSQDVGPTKLYLVAEEVIQRLRASGFHVWDFV